jgi:16S rRNA (cytidine1402-2'-O)-methyltransferase
MPGTLYVVATPIGNLEDLTFRALRILREVDLIAAEDTRRTAKLLAHYQVRKPLFSLREHNEVRETPRLLAKLTGGQNIALVSDAGTPGIADPGALLVQAARKGGIPVVPIPGANAIAAALSASGVQGDEYVFMGFPPATGLARDNWFHRLAKESRPVVLFEAPHRILDTIRRIDDIYPFRPTSICREITKINEEFVIRPNNVGAMKVVRPIGEFTLVVAATPEASAGSADDFAHAVEMFGLLTEQSSLDEIDAIEIVSLKFKLPIRLVRKLIKKAAILAKQQSQSSP